MSLQKHLAKRLATQIRNADLFFYILAQHRLCMPVHGRGGFLISSVAVTHPLLPAGRKSSEFRVIGCIMGRSGRDGDGNPKQGEENKRA